MAYRSSQARGQIRAAAEVYATALAVLDPSRISDLCLSLQPHQILNPLSEAGDRTHILTGIKPTSFQRQRWFLNLLSPNGNSDINLFDAQVDPGAPSTRPLYLWGVTPVDWVDSLLSALKRCPRLILCILAPDLESAISPKEVVPHGGKRH